MSFAAGKVMLITGPTNGIALSLVERFTKADEKPKKMVLVSRNPEKLESTKKMVEQAGIEASTYVCDVSSAEQCLRTVETIVKAEPELHILVSNAGQWVDHANKATVTDASGATHEFHFAINFLSMALLVRGLTPLLEKSAAPGSPSRIVISGSFFGGMVHNPPTSCCDVDLDDVGKFETRDVNGCPFSPLCFPACLGFYNLHSYSESKLLQHLWAKHYAADVLDPKKVTVLVIDPGAVWGGFEQLRMLSSAPCYSPKGCIWTMFTAGYSYGLSAIRNPTQGSYSLWRATTQPFEGATGKFVASGPVLCPCACPLTPIGIQLDFGVGCHATSKSAAVYEKALAIEATLCDTLGIAPPAVATMKRDEGAASALSMV